VRSLSAPIRVLAYLALLLIVAIIAGSMIFWRSKPQSKTPHPEDTGIARDPGSQDTRINETSFRLTLPGICAVDAPSDPNRRNYHTRAEELTVSIFGSLLPASGKSHDEKAATFRRWVNKRRDLETRVPGTEGAKVTEPIFGESGGVFAARYTGFDPSSQRRFHCMLLASSSAFEIFYYEAEGMTEQAAEDRAKPIFKSVDIPR